MWSKKLQSVSATLTFDPDGYCVLDVSDLIGSSASVFTHIIEGRLLDLNHLVEVLYFNARRWPQVVTILGPCNTRSRPWWWETRLYTGALSWNQSQRYIKEKRLTEWIFLTATLIFYKKKKIFSYKISCDLALTLTLLQRCTPGAAPPLAGPVWSWTSLWETARWGQPRPPCELQGKQTKTSSFTNPVWPDKLTREIREDTDSTIGV